MSPHASELVRSLERLRERVLKRLDDIEELARSRPGSSTVNPRHLELSLSEKDATIEDLRARLAAEEHRVSSSCKEAVEAIEEDRKRLAEAWSRLETERIELSQSARARHQDFSLPDSPPPGRPSSQPRSVAPNTVTESILRQFQALNHDVRRAAEERCHNY